MRSNPVIDPSVPPELVEQYRRLRVEEAELERTRTKRARAALLRRFPHPLLLLQHFEPSTVIVPSVELLSKTWVDVLAAEDGRAVISQPAQTGKTVCARAAIWFALMQDPSRRIMYGSYSLSLAKDTGQEVRRLVEEFGAPYGLRLDRGRQEAGDWYLERVEGAPHPGRVKIISPTATATGVPADIACLDDVYSGEAEANSPAVTRHVERWYESTVRLRLAPGGSMVAIGTRFAEHDLLAKFLADGWPQVNIPALADGHAKDSLDGVEGARTDDGYLVTPRGHTAQTWRKIRADVGERVWTSTAQGSPTAPKGNLFLEEQWNRIKLEDLPRLVQRVIACDPAETGLGDEAGILVGGRAADGQMYLLADLSGKLAQAQWARRLCLGSLRWDTDHVLQETTLGMGSSVRDAWSIIVRQATALQAHHLDVEMAQAALAMAGDRAAMDSTELAELVDLVGKVRSLPSTGPRVQTVRPRLNKRVRAEAVTGLWAVGRAHIVDRLPLLEWEAQSWNPDAGGKGGKSPNRVDVMAHLLTYLDMAGGPTRVASPVATAAGGSSSVPRLPRRSGAARDHGLAVIPGGLPTRAGAAGGLPSRAGAGSRRGGFRPAG